MSPYNYCANDPVNCVDPDGRKIKIGHWYQQIAAKFSNDSYVSKVNRDINTLKGMDPELKQMFITMEDANETITILHADAREGDHKGKNGFNPETNTIYYDPDNDTSPLPNEETRPAIIGFAHEGGHGENKVNGTRTPITVKDMENHYNKNDKIAKKEADRKLNKNEKNSIDKENIVRKILGLNLRGYDYANGEGVIK